MKISKEDLRRIIKEELGAMADQDEDQEEQADLQPELGAGKTTAGDMKKGLAGAAKKSSGMKVTTQERAIIMKFQKFMIAFAEENNLAGGTMLQKLQLLIDLMKKNISEEGPE